VCHLYDTIYGELEQKVSILSTAKRMIMMLNTADTLSADDYAAVSKHPARVYLC
jgi:hypothetical protein